MKSIKELVYESLILEGIDFDRKTKTVSYNPSHEDNVDTSIENNPTVDNDIIKDVEVWSIFKRKRGNKEDGNPLIYALKGEQWKFKSNKDKLAIEEQFNKIADKFVKTHKFGITIIMPSTNILNDYIANIITKKSNNTKVIKGLIRKMTTQEVYDIVLDFDSKFRKQYAENLDLAFDQLDDYLDDMDDKKDGKFTRHLIKDSKMRNVLDKTLKLSNDKYAKYANKINGQDVLLIDDTISRGQTIKEVCDIIQDSYAPKSITVLTLLSKLN